MTNREAISSLCTAIASAFYPPAASVEMTAHTLGIDADAEAGRKDPLVFRAAALLVRGFIEGSRSEGGQSVSVRSEEAVRQSLLAWCEQYGLDPETELAGQARTIDDGTGLW